MCCYTSLGCLIFVALILVMLLPKKLDQIPSQCFVNPPFFCQLKHFVLFNLRKAI
ncbi:hypothetical protein REPUB_Repub20aG0106400 [Reevesia pubescens]